ncbi:MAG TPA: hypothetical protein ENJ95_16905 [Bacteroidetes bacterium]|nr:hypothetical protein [Bacteroidota bacterium]
MDKALRKELKIDKDQLKALKKKLAKVEGYPERGIETWFRVTLRNLYTRRQIVDTKSNILITVNSIILSIILGSLYPRLDNDPHLLWAIIPMVLTNLFSIAYAIFATRPVLASGKFTKEEIKEKKAGLMTFDDFSKMPFEDYDWAIDEMMGDKDFLYGTMKRDIYRLGVDLRKRYHNIQVAYNIFLFGITVSIVAFGVCHVFF